MIFSNSLTITVTEERFQSTKKTGTNKLLLSKDLFFSKLKHLSPKHKNNKFIYYTANFASLLIPAKIFEIHLPKLLLKVLEYDTGYILNRVNYYNKLNKTTELNDDCIQLIDFKLKRKFKTYFFDTYEHTKYFPKRLKMSYFFGDITAIPDAPSFVKSRPINGDISNSVLLKLNKVRHFNFINDKKPFHEKKNMLVGRFDGEQPQRVKFLRMYNKHPLCNVGQIHRKNKQRKFEKEYLTISEQLNYKFILCLEGNDVSTAVKWVMSSNSIAVMPKPKYETWFMEGCLIPNYHYIEIKDDYSDLEEKINYYIDHTEAAEDIISNANKYVNQFKNKRQEQLISLLTVIKYLKNTNQEF